MIEIRELTEQERKHYTFCPCCNSRLKPQTAEEFTAVVMRGFYEAKLRKAQEK